MSTKTKTKALWKGWGLRRFRVVRALLRLTRPGKTTINGYTMYLDRNDAVVSRDLARGEYEPLETSVLVEQLRPGMIVLDIGANIGYYTLMFAQVVGKNGQVHAFEPAPRTLDILRKNISVNGYKNVTVHACAVGDVEGTSTLYLNDYNAGDNRLYTSLGMKSVTVPLHVIDTLIPSDVKVDLVKMDIQGYEWHALQGMRGIIERDHPVIVLELSPQSIARSGGSAESLLQYLQDQGYSFEELCEGAGGQQESRLSTTKEDLVRSYPETSEAFTNILCVPK